MATSAIRDVGWRFPELWLTSILPVVTPRPICIGFMPPLGHGYIGGELAPRSVWLKTSWNVALLDLNPGVFTLATLLPITSMRVWWARRPDTAANSERIIFVH
jgi:hypothetical protein